MRLLICGGRDFADRAMFARAMTLQCLHRRPTVIIEGGARGADALAREWAKHRGVENETYPADWKAHGRAAGPMRNQRMLEIGRPDMVMAFPGGPGTADMVRRAEVAGVQVIRPNFLEIPDR